MGAEFCRRVYMHGSWYYSPVSLLPRRYNDRQSRWEETLSKYKHGPEQIRTVRRIYGTHEDCSNQPRDFDRILIAWVKRGPGAPRKYPNYQREATE